MVCPKGIKYSFPDTINEFAFGIFSAWYSKQDKLPILIITGSNSVRTSLDLQI